MRFDHGPPSRDTPRPMFQEIRDSIRTLYLADPRPLLIGFSGGKDSTMVASLIFEVVAGIPAEQRTKPISLIRTNTRALPMDLAAR